MTLYECRRSFNFHDFVDVCINNTFVLLFAKNIKLEIGDRMWLEIVLLEIGNNQ